MEKTLTYRVMLRPYGSFMYEYRFFKVRSFLELCQQIKDSIQLQTYEISDVKLIKIKKGGV